MLKIYYMLTIYAFQCKYCYRYAYNIFLLSYWNFPVKLIISTGCPKNATHLTGGSNKDLG